jgi:hypothetical protein
MNKITATIVFCVLASGFIYFVSCKKDDKPQPTPDRLQLITQTNWQLTNEFYEKKGDPNSRSDLFTTDYAACERDDIYRFQDNGSLYRSDSAVSCGNGYHPFGFYTGGAWSTNANVDTMGLEMFMAFKYLFNIQKVDQNTLELRQDQKNYFDEDVSYTWRFKAVP